MKREDTLMQWFLSHCTQKKLPAKTLLVSSARCLDRLHYLLSGQAYLIAYDDMSHPRILEQMNAGSLISYDLLFFKNHHFLSQYPWNIRLHTQDSVVASISGDNFLKLCKQSPELWSRLACQQQWDLQKIVDRLSQHLFLDVTERLLGRLSSLAQTKEAITHPKGIQIRSSRQELGQWVGCSRETVGRALRILEQQQRINAHGKTILVYREPPAIAPTTNKNVQLKLFQ